MSKEHAYAYEAGYRDGSVHYELEHCPACKNIADLQEALDENAKLRELCSDMFKLAGEVYVPFEDADDWMARDGDIERRMRELGVGVDR